ncbi:hypothetical protein [Streptomyces sp. NPDC051909]|uniref:DUF7455 domain-containing protein n=1 Tax=Streptomyces sp. NPDC051909 TaxID=3154944 RepID=UPI00341B4CF2
MPSAENRPLTALDRCDRCGAQAYIRAVLGHGRELVFCVHHGRQHRHALEWQASHIQDESHLLVQSVR